MSIFSSFIKKRNISKKQLEIIVANLFMLADSDGEVHPSEMEKSMEIINRLRDKWNINDDIDIENIDSSHYDSLEDMKEEDKLFVMESMVEVANSDGKFDYIELYIIVQFSQMLRATDESLEKILDYASSEHQIKSNIYNKMARIIEEKGIEAGNLFIKSLEEEVKDTNQIKDLRLELEKVKSELFQITDSEKGDIYKYNYWFDIIETRAKDPIQDESNLSRSINGHYEEYHYRMIESINHEKIKFIKPRLICFLEIFKRLTELEKFKFRTSDDTILFSKYLFHSKASLYSAVKFILLDLTSGKMMLEKLFPDYDPSVLESKVDDNELDDLTKVSLELLSRKLRLSLNLNIKQKANDLINEKNTTAYVYLIKFIDSSFSISDANDSEIKVPHLPIKQDVFNEIKTLDVKQQEYIERCFSALILWCNNFKFQSLIIFLFDLYDRTNLKLPSELEEILELISNSLQEPESSASRICNSCGNPTELSENYCDKCGNKMNL